MFTKKKNYGSLPVIEDTIGSILPGNSNKCSVLETSFNLIAVITGAGMLSLPFAAKSMGWSAFLALLFLGAIFMYSYQLLVESIECYRRKFLPFHFPGSHNHIDYITLGKEVFGPIGEKIVLFVFGIEMLLALTSFLINIGLNFHFIIPSISVTTFILVASLVTIFLATFELNIAAYSSALGLTMTVFTVIALIWSGSAFNFPVEWKEYDYFRWEGVSMSLGLIAFCFGGHATFPKMYESMAEPKRYREVLSAATVVTLLLYAIFMVLGYYFYAQFTLAPITLNIGTGLNHANHQYGKLLRCFAALGVISNLQVTCPLVTLPLRDVILRVMDLSFTPLNMQVTSTFIALVATILALSLQGQFAATCAFVGSVATFTDSIIFPIVFHYNLVGSSCSTQRIILHGGILAIAFICAFSAIYDDFEAMMSFR